MMLKNYDQLVEINHNPNWPNISGYPYRILIIDGSGSGKTNVLLNLIKHHGPDVDKVYLYFKDPFESKYHINSLSIEQKKQVLNPSAFIVYSQTIDDAYENLEEATRKRKVLIVFDDVIVDMETNKTLGYKATEFVTRGRKLNISLALISQPYFKVPKDLRLNAVCFITKISSKRELQEITLNDSSDIEFADLI